MVEHTKAIQDKFAEIAAKLSNLDSFFDDIPGARIGGGGGVIEKEKVDYAKVDETFTPELAAFLSGIDDSTTTAPTTPTTPTSQPFTSSDYEISITTPTSSTTTPTAPSPPLPAPHEELPAPSTSGMFCSYFLPSFYHFFSHYIVHRFILHFRYAFSLHNFPPFFSPSLSTLFSRMLSHHPSSHRSQYTVGKPPPTLKRPPRPLRDQTKEIPLDEPKA